MLEPIAVFRGASGPKNAQETLQSLLAASIVAHVERSEAASFLFVESRDRIRAVPFVDFDANGIKNLAEVPDVAPDPENAASVYSWSWFRKQPIEVQQRLLLRAELTKAYFGQGSLF